MIGNLPRVIRNMGNLGEKSFVDVLDSALDSGCSQFWLQR